MLPGPIFTVEVSTAGRRGRFILVRSLYAMLLFAGLWIAYAVFQEGRFTRTPMSIAETASLANVFYHVCAWGQLIALVVFSPAIVAGAIAQDRERQILDALFASDLRDAEIVLSKFAARALHVSYIVLAGLPVLQIASLMGGIAPQRLWMSFAISLTTMVLIAALALLVSVTVRRARDAVLGTYVLLFLWFVVPLLLTGMELMGMVPGLSLLASGPLQPAFTAIAAPNPFLAMLHIHAGPATRGGADPWQEVMQLMAVQLALAAVALLAAVWLLRRVHARIADRPERHRWWRWHLAWRPAVFRRAMLWKECFAERTSGWMRVAVWIVLGATMTVILGFACWWFLESWEPDTYGLYGYHRGFVTDSPAARSFLTSMTALVTFVSTCLVPLAAARAATTVTSERERDTWTPLMSTTLTGAEVVLPKIVGNIFAFRWAWGAVAFLWFLSLVRAVPLMVVPLAFWLCEIAAITWFAASLGVYFSLRMQNTIRAMGATVGVLFAVGGGYFFCCLPFFFGGGPDDALILTLAPMVPFLLAVPQMIGIEGMPGREGPRMLTALFSGTVGYLLAGLALSAYCVASFDRLAGRSHRNADWWAAVKDNPSRLPLLPFASSPLPAETQGPSA